MADGINVEANVATHGWKCPQALFDNLEKLEGTNASIGYLGRHLREFVSNGYVWSESDYKVFAPNTPVGDFLVQEELERILGDINKQNLQDQEDGVDVKGIKEAITAFLNDPGRQELVTSQKAEAGRMLARYREIRDIKGEKNFYFDMGDNDSYVFFQDMMDAELTSDGRVNEDLKKLVLNIQRHMGERVPEKKINDLKSALLKIPENDRTGAQRKLIDSIDVYIAFWDNKDKRRDYYRDFIKDDKLQLPQEVIYGLFEISKGLSKDHPVMQLIEDMKKGVNRKLPFISPEKGDAALAARFNKYDLTEQIRELIKGLPDDTIGKSAALGYLNPYLDNQKNRDSAYESRANYVRTIIYDNFKGNNVEITKKDIKDICDALSAEREGEGKAYGEMLGAIRSFLGKRDLESVFGKADPEFDNWAKALSDKISAYVDGEALNSWKVKEAIRILNYVDPEKADSYIRNGRSMERDKEAFDAAFFKAGEEDRQREAEERRQREEENRVRIQEQKRKAKEYGRVVRLYNQVDDTSHKAEKALEKVLEITKANKVNNAALRDLMVNLQSLSDCRNMSISEIQSRFDAVDKVIKEYENPNEIKWAEKTSINNKISAALSELKEPGVLDQKGFEKVKDYSTMEFRQAFQEAYRHKDAIDLYEDRQKSKEKANKVYMDLLTCQSEARRNYEALEKATRSKKKSDQFQSMMAAMKEFADMDLKESNIFDARSVCEEMGDKARAYLIYHRKDLFHNKDREEPARRMMELSYRTYSNTIPNRFFNGSDTFNNQTKGLEVKEVIGGKKIKMSDAREADGFVDIEAENVEINGPVRDVGGLNGLLHEENPNFGENLFHNQNQVEVPKKGKSRKKGQKKPGLG